MGLGFFVSAKLPKGKTGPAILKSLAKAGPAALHDEVMRAWFTTAEGEGALNFHLFPGTEPLEFRLDGQNVTASHKTSTTGPGYHAETIEVMDRLGDICGLSWNWKGEDEGGDETGFALSRDQRALEAAMAEQLGGIAKMLKKDAGRWSGTVFLNWGLDGPRPVGPWDLMSPLGPWSFDWMFPLAEGGDLARAAAEFYPWWSRERTPTEWAKLAALLMWSEVRWHAPASEHQAKAVQAAILAAERAGPAALRPFGIEAADLKELRALAAEDADQDRPPRATGFGAFRGPACWTVAGGWTVRAPGYAYTQLEEEGAVHIYFGTRAVRIATYELGAEHTRGKQPATIARTLATQDDVHEVVDLSHDHIAAFAARLTPTDDEPFWGLSGAAVAGKEAAIVSVSYEDKKDSAWAEETFRSVFRPSE